MDKFHFKGHVDPWCKEHCNPNKHAGLVNKNMSVCEQTFAWIKGFGAPARYMNGCRLKLVVLLLVWMQHERWRPGKAAHVPDDDAGGGEGGAAAGEGGAEGGGSEGEGGE